MANRKLEKGKSKKAQNEVYKAENRSEKNKLTKLARANRKNPADSQTAEAYVKLYHKLHG